LLALTESHILKLLDQQNGTEIVSNMIVRASNFDDSTAHNHVLGILMRAIQDMPVLISHPLVSNIQQHLCEHTTQHRGDMMRFEAEERKLIEQRDKCEQINRAAQEHVERARHQQEEEENVLKSEEAAVAAELEELRKRQEQLQQQQQDIALRRQAHEESAEVCISELTRVCSDSATDHAKTSEAVERNRASLKRSSTTATHLSQAVCAMQHTCKVLEQAWSVLWSPGPVVGPTQPPAPGPFLGGGTPAGFASQQQQQQQYQYQHHHQSAAPPFSQNQNRTNIQHMRYA
jgi:hypothetical protein